MKNNNHKYLWGMVLALSLAVMLTASVYISNMKQMTPNENAEVIALVPVEEEVIEYNDVGTAPSSEKRDNTTGQNIQGGSVRTEQRQLGVKKAEMQSGDDTQIWTTETQVDIFKKYYTGTAEAGTENEITVENAGDVDDRKLIAPGTESEYTFWVKNTGETDISYRVSFDENQYGSLDIPLEVRLKCGDDYFLGSSSEWASIRELDKAEHEGKLREKNYARYTLEWRWPFEIDDVYDTALGNQAVKELLEQEIIIYTYGEGEDIPIFDWITATGVKTGDASNGLLWLLILLLALAAMGCIYKINRRRSQKEAEELE